MRLTKRCPTRRSWLVAYGMITTSSWSWPLGEAPLRASHADDLEAQVVHQDVLAERILAIREQCVGDRPAQHGHRGIGLARPRRRRTCPATTGQSRTIGNFQRSADDLRA